MYNLFNTYIMYNQLLVTTPTWFNYTLLIIYTLGFIFCIFLKGIIEDTPLKRSTNRVRYGVLFLIWVMSPAVITGLLMLTLKVFFRNGDKTE